MKSSACMCSPGEVDELDYFLIPGGKVILPEVFDDASSVENCLLLFTCILDAWTFFLLKHMS